MRSFVSFNKYLAPSTSVSLTLYFRSFKAAEIDIADESLLPMTGISRVTHWCTEVYLTMTVQHSSEARVNNTSP